MNKKRFSNRQAFLWITGIALSVLSLDILTKRWAVKVLKYEHPIEIIPNFFRFAYGENTGIAFGLMQDQGYLLHILTPIAFIVLIVIIYQQFAANFMDRWFIAIFGLLIGGALGNILNRLYSGYVIDFIDFYNLFGYHWPTFNIADSALTIGEVLLFGKIFFGEWKRVEKEHITEEKESSSSVVEESTHVSHTD